MKEYFRWCNEMLFMCNVLLNLQINLNWYHSHHFTDVTYGSAEVIHDLPPEPHCWELAVPEGRRRLLQSSALPTRPQLNCRDITFGYSCLLIHLAQHGVSFITIFFL